MSNSIDSVLAEAHDLIEQGLIDDAQELLQPLVDTEQDNPDFWWVYLHAIRDPDEAENALNHLKQLDPQYPGMETITGEPVVDPASSGGIQRLGESSSLLDDFDEDDEWPDDDFDDLELDEEPVTEVQSKGRRSFLLPLLALLAIVIVIALAFLLLSGGGDGDDDEDPTSVAQGAATSTQSLIPTVDSEMTEEVVVTDDMVETEAPDVTDEPEPTETDDVTEEPTEVEETQESVPTETEVPATDTEEPATPTEEIPTDTAVPVATDTPEPPSLSEIFTGFQLGENSGRLISDSSLGQVYAVSVCSQQDRPLRQILNDAMVLLASEQSLPPEETSGLAIELVNCDLQQPINIVGVPLDVAESFAAGTIGEAEFLAQWRAIGQNTAP